MMDIIKKIVIILYLFHDLQRPSAAPHTIFWEGENFSAK